MLTGYDLGMSTRDVNFSLYAWLVSRTGRRSNTIQGNFLKLNGTAYAI